MTIRGIKERSDTFPNQTHEMASKETIQKSLYFKIKTFNVEGLEPSHSYKPHIYSPNNMNNNLKKKIL